MQIQLRMSGVHSAHREGLAVPLADGRGDRHGLSSTAEEAVAMETRGIDCQGVLQHTRTSPDKVAPGMKMPPCLYRLSPSDDGQQSAAVGSFDPFRCTSGYILVSGVPETTFRKAI